MFVLLLPADESIKSDKSFNADKVNKQESLILQQRQTDKQAYNSI